MAEWKTKLAGILAVAIGGPLGIVALHAAREPVAAPAPHAVASKPIPAPVPTKVAIQSVVPKPIAKPTAKPAADETYVIKRILPVNGPMRFGDWYWSDENVPAGPVIITVDLKAQVLSIFRSGYEIGTAVILYGDDAKPTPTGTFPITQKDAHHVSNIYKGAPMPYMQRLTNDGVSIHGTTVQAGYMTHGCVGVPTPFARLLFGATKVGDRVIITRGAHAPKSDTPMAA
jgi:lipoprotein-anchoring transpeptidase ErfK/SrfK